MFIMESPDESEVELYKPEAPHWNGPLCRVIGISDDTERDMSPTNHYYLHTLETQGMWVYTQSGFVEYREGSRSVRLGAGTLLAIRQPSRGSLHYSRKGLPWKRIYFGITGEAALSLFDYIVNRYGSVQELPLDCAIVRKARSFCRMVKQQPKRSAQFWSAQAYNLLNDWWAECENRIPTTDGLASQNFNSSQITMLNQSSVKEFAEKMGYSRSHLSRTLKKTWHKNPSDVLRNLRLREAKRLLKETKLPVVEIATKVGFSSSSSFCASFKKYVGVTPLNYRHKL
jgi:AraC-like DNA-binding protein